ncbi:hypothetical protein LJR186_002977 [Microbacterium foliorum]
MRTVVIGASNSLVKGGVVQGMIDGGLNVVANGSLGHSQATILPFRLSDSQYGSLDFDHLIVEIATNEQIALRSSLANFTTIKSVLDWTARWCAERGIGLTLVTMPESASYLHAGDMRRFGVRRFLNEYAKERRLQIFDGYDWLDDRITQQGADLEGSFDTPAHIQTEIAHAFGVRIAESIDPTPPRSKRQLRAAPDFEYVAMAESESWARADTIERSTSIGSAQLLRLRAEQEFELELKRGNVVGTVHNAAGSTAILQVDGVASHAKRMDGHPGEKLILTAWGLRTPVPVDGATRLRALPVGYLPDLEHNHATIWRPLSRHARGLPTVELAGLVLANRPG